VTGPAKGIGVGVCPCGATHELAAMVRAPYEAVTEGLNPDITVDISGERWRVPRIFIAVHGLRAADMPELAVQYGFEKA
jgi:hypothetical protein